MINEVDSLGSGLTGAGSGERAMNDISLTIGFCMLIFVFILVPYLTIMNRIAVNVPATKAEVTQNGGGAQNFEIPVFMLKDGDGYQIRLGAEEGTAVGLFSLVDRIVEEYQDKVKESKSAELLFRADRDLSYQNVMEVLTELGSLEERFDKPVEYHLQYVDEREG